MLQEIRENFDPYEKRLPGVKHLRKQKSKDESERSILLRQAFKLMLSACSLIGYNQNSAFRWFDWLIAQSIKHQFETWYRNVSSECAEPPKFFSPEDGRSITAISSFPGSGNTWARHLLHMATGYWTGNRRGSNHLKQYGWMAEDINCRDRTTIAQKTHRLHHK